MAIGEQIKYLRKQQHLTQKQLSEKSGIAEITIRQYEAGRYNPKIEALKKLAIALNCEVSNIDESLSINKKIPYFAYGLQTLRIDRGLTQKELAKEINVSHKNISNWENGKRMPLFDIVEKIVKYFDTSLLYLLYGEEEYKKSSAIINENAIAREAAIRSAPKFISHENGAIDYPIRETNSLPAPPKFTDRSISFEEAKAREKLNDTLDSIFDEESSDLEREKIAMHLNEILTSYSNLNEIGRETAVESIKELCYSSTLTESKLDNIRFNRIQKKLNNGESLTQEEVDFEHAYWEKPLKKLGVIFENYYFMLNKEGQKFARESINKAIEQLIFLTKIPSCRKTPPEPPEE